MWFCIPIKMCVVCTEKDEFQCEMSSVHANEAAQSSVKNRSENKEWG